ncbi:actin T1-like protein [Rhynchospora pubera]|uniref:Actin T1-like protein n=1 Tax=Rhynchospora pubera TaxID=906938 RepID=A0AAV8ER45_9POAL|nr:actin T1-like protein [Rhynchospora pubera]
MTIQGYWAFVNWDDDPATIKATTLSSFLSPFPFRPRRREEEFELQTLKSPKEMDDSWKRAYRGDSGVPHSDPQQLVSTWKGTFALASVAWLQTQTSNLIKSLQFNWSDKALKIDQQKWKKIFDKKQKETVLSNTNDSPTK